MKWVAIVVFLSPEECDKFNEAHNLQQQFEPQCVLIDEASLAPRTSLRPRSRQNETE